MPRAQNARCTCDRRWILAKLRPIDIPISKERCGSRRWRKGTRRHRRRNSHEIFVIRARLWLKRHAAPARYRLLERSQTGASHRFIAFDIAPGGARARASSERLVRCLRNVLTIHKIGARDQQVTSRCFSACHPERSRRISNPLPFAVSVHAGKELEILRLAQDDNIQIIDCRDCRLRHFPRRCRHRRR